MNRSAKQHLDKAADYVAKGEEFYRKAAEEIVAAQEVDPTLTNRQIGERFGREPAWISRLVTWHTSGSGRNTPFSATEPHQARYQRMAKQALRSTPEIVAELDPAEQRELAKALDRESLKRQREREKISGNKFRNVVGDDTADGLELAQDMKDTEWWLVKGHQDAQSFLKAANRLGIENTPEHWRKSCLDWIESIESNLGMAKALLQGDDIDWSAFEDMLKEVS